MKPSDDFIRRTRNPDVPPPAKVERTEKGPGHVEITSTGMVVHHGYVRKPKLRIVRRAA